MRKLLVIRFGALGDLIHLSPSLAYLKAQRPELEIHVLTSPAYESLVQAFEGVSQVWTYDKKRPWRHLWALAQALRAAGIDGIVNLHPSFKTWLLGNLLQAPTAVYHKEKLAVKGQAQRATSRRHAVMDFYQPFARLLDLPMPEALVPRLAVGTPSPEIRKPPGETWVGIIPGVGNKRSNRAWPIESYRALIAQLVKEQPNLRVMLVGGPDEQPLAEALVALGRVENLCGRHSILETAALLSQCDLVIGGDTGPTHLAAAVGVPIVSPFGPTSIDRTGPRGTDVIRELLPPDSLTCWPCERAECPLTGAEHLACMTGIPVEAVYEASQAVLAENGQQKTSG